MSAFSMRAAVLQRRDVASRIDQRLDRFCPRRRPVIRAMAGRHPWLADLALSFPALLFGLAVPRRGFHPECAIARIMAGASIRSVAQDAGVAWWLRNLPIEAFTDAISILPDSADFRRRISNYAPRSPKKAAQWLQWVSRAAQWGDEEIALWIAKEAHNKPSAINGADLTRICVWAWHFRNSREAMFALLDKDWNFDLSFSSASDYAYSWIENVRLYLDLHNKKVDDYWFSPMEINGYAFEPLKTVEDILAEKTAMRHCIARYGINLACDSSRLWSVREQGKRIATLEIRSHVHKNFRIPEIAQLKGEANADISPEVWEAVWIWILRHDLLGIKPREAKHVLWRQATWISLWRPYWLSKKRIPGFLPLKPCARWSLLEE